MTISYSLSVSQATFGGFLKLLFRWTGSIYKAMWRETLTFCVLFVLLQVFLRHGLSDVEKSAIWIVIQFVNSLGVEVPFSFVLGFYVNFVASRWMSQFLTVPWPDRLAHAIASYVHGSDERSRMIRRTLGRYAVLLQILTYQTVSTSVKKRFPKTRHLVESGLMTPEEMAIYERYDFSYGKWWLPCHWFSSLAVRAKKEGRIKDSVLLKALMKELLSYRTMCASTIAYDWISVPLAYTQVATITTYFLALILLVGKQTLDVPGTDGTFTLDYYFPFVTVYRFLWTVGWLKVAQQILNPYGEDDDDFELNWTLDRSIQLTLDVVDQIHMMHPKIKKDAFWDVQDIKLPQTAHSARFLKNPELGSALKLGIEDVNYLPMDELCEKDSEENFYRSQSVKRIDVGRQNSSFIRRIFNSGFTQSNRRKSKKTAARSSSSLQGISNPAFSTNDETEGAVSTHSTPPANRKSSLRRLVKKISPPNKQNSVKLNQKSLIYKRQKSYTVDQTADQSVKNLQGETGSLVSSKNSQALEKNNQILETRMNRDEISDDFEPTMDNEDSLMPSIPEESSRANSLASLEFKVAALRGERPSQQMDRAFDIVKEASEVLKEISESASDQERWKSNEGKGYESCCSGASSERASEDSLQEDDTNEESGEVVLNIDDKFGGKDLSKETHDKL